MLATLSISEYANKLASKEPAPGGGSAAALSGLLGACLMELAINLSQGRPEFAPHAQLLAEKQADLTRLHIELQLMIDRDASAFLALVDAQNLPESTKEEQQVRLVSIKEAVLQAAEVPLWIARSCLGILETGTTLLGKVNAHAVSDLLIGALASHTGVVGALLNTVINLPLLEDEQLMNAYSGEVLLLRTAADELIATMKERVYAESPFGIMREPGC